MAPLAGFKASVYVSNTGTSTPTTNEPMTDNGSHGYFYVTSNAHRYLDPTVTPVVQEELDEIQTVTITGNPTGGTFTLTYSGQTTAGIAWNATASAVQSAIVALSNIGANGVAVSGGPGPNTPWIVEFQNSKGFSSQSLMTINTAGLTGGTPGGSVTRTQAGQGWTTLSTGYTLYPCGGVVILTTPALSAGVGVRLSTANYLTISQAMQAKSVDVQTQMDIADVTTFASGGWKVKLPLLGDMTFKLSQWWVDVFYITNLGALLVLVAYSGANANQQLACYGYLKTDGIKIDVKAPIEQSLDFESHGGVLFIQS